jgi:hypothetical protein
VKFVPSLAILVLTKTSLDYLRKLNTEKLKFLYCGRHSGRALIWSRTYTVVRRPRQLCQLGRKVKF